LFGSTLSVEFDLTPLTALIDSQFFLIRAAALNCVARAPTSFPPAIVSAVIDHLGDESVIVRCAAVLALSNILFSLQEASVLREICAASLPQLLPLLCELFHSCFDNRLIDLAAKMASAVPDMFSSGLGPFLPVLIERFLALTADPLEGDSARALTDLTVKLLLLAPGVFSVEFHEVFVAKLLSAVGSQIPFFQEMSIDILDSLVLSSPQFSPSFWSIVAILPPAVRAHNYECYHSALLVMVHLLMRAKEADALDSRIGRAMMDAAIADAYFRDLSEQDLGDALSWMSSVLVAFSGNRDLLDVSAQVLPLLVREVEKENPDCTCLIRALIVYNPPFFIEFGLPFVLFYIENSDPGALGALFLIWDALEGDAQLEVLVRFAQWCADAGNLRRLHSPAFPDLSDARSILAFLEVLGRLPASDPNLLGEFDRRTFPFTVESLPIIVAQVA
jgi:hypothetical protein